MLSLANRCGIRRITRGVVCCNTKIMHFAGSSGTPQTNKELSRTFSWRVYIAVLLFSGLEIWAQPVPLRHILRLASKPVLHFWNTFKLHPNLLLSRFCSVNLSTFYFDLSSLEPDKPLMMLHCRKRTGQAMSNTQHPQDVNRRVSSF